MKVLPVNKQTSEAVEQIDRWFTIVCPLTLKMLTSCRYTIVRNTMNDYSTYTNYETDVLQFFMNSETGMLFNREIKGFLQISYTKPSISVNKRFEKGVKLHDFISKYPEKNKPSTYLIFTEE